ncbi:hypothetical protein NB724_004103 [Pantoea ananatis]|uniref:Uncharacterized protein n=1 Tax=Pantoea ananas TaxID=553 RepID=A0AAJ1CYR4_PANAN|nr:hypothetical protein [Pantoea ananatis]MCW0331699.1 hypothetical protein [Pantoea ananatis]MCW0337095.1 hypothetical protein [Pantoea ananatis]MCW0343636.1 hypothetical protein [Pantoea ananatis]MCW0349420.1 hypothetical protein [Pantoea ananatis]
MRLVLITVSLYAEQTNGFSIASQRMHAEYNDQESASPNQPGMGSESVTQYSGP